MDLQWEATHRIECVFICESVIAIHPLLNHHHFTFSQPPPPSTRPDVNKFSRRDLDGWTENGATQSTEAVPLSLF